MNPTQPTGDDAKLQKTLGEWKVNATLPPRFQEEVWRRIAASEAKASAPGVRQSLAAAIRILFARPAFAAACVAVFTAAGFSAGWAQAHEQVALIDASLSHRYVQSVDPYQSPRP
ncbi:MAG: hypothetical protein HY301_01535 [Verrucomicrobia bacterium]|nr:hypothetical protein [Verrucomicrobiota bacterium]